MNFTNLRLRQGCWIALLAMLALTLAPTLSHALAAVRGTTAWVDVCTPRGAQRVAVAVDEQARGQELPRTATGHLEHCAYCGLAAHVPLLPGASAAWLVPPLAGASPQAQRTQQPRRPMAWQGAQPRAPPAPF